MHATNVEGAIYDFYIFIRDTSLLLKSLEGQQIQVISMLKIQRHIFHLTDPQFTSPQ